jgi:hypothetical protein
MQRTRTFLFSLLFIEGVMFINDVSAQEIKDTMQNSRIYPSTGYRGIWFELGQKTEFGDKYSGGLGTYTANHVPMAAYSAREKKTFFTYGGTVKGKRHLLIMVGYYDHKTGQVSRPYIVHDKEGVNDPHDNGSLTIDAQGHIWVFVSGRGQVRPGFKYRSVRPFDIKAFELIATSEVTYPQPWILPGGDFLHLFTKYTAGRELYFHSSSDGRVWGEEHKLAGFGGHYQVSGEHGGKVATFFNYHPGGDVDLRTNLYYAQTTDGGQTWTTADGKVLELPLDKVDNAALVFDYAAQGTLMYTCDLNFDKDGNPLLLYVTSKHAHPGPKGDPREFVVARWDGGTWQTYSVASTDHNYDMGSLYVAGDEWTVIAPTAPGPQAGHTGGEMVKWTSRNSGKTWHQERDITRGSTLNHTYARRPHPANDPFFAFWADGDPTRYSESRLYFCDSSGKRVFRLPEEMQGDFAMPVELK